MELLVSMPDTLKFVIVFVLILGLLVPLVWRLFNVGPRHSHPRGRQPRLSVMETMTVDVRHRLVLVKRDNVEHLLLVGGPSNIVVESNIARPGAVREPRPIPDARPEAMRQQAEAVETPEWSLPLEPAARSMRTVDLDAAQPEPPARTAREAMVDSMRAVRSGAAARRGPPMDADGPPDEIAAPTLSPAPPEVNQRPVQEPRRAIAPPPQPAPEAAQPMAPPEPKRERTAPPRPVPSGNAAPPPRTSQPVSPNAPRPVQPVASAKSAGGPPPRPQSSDEGNFAEMAQRLEAALRRPAKARAEAPPPPAPPARPPVRQEQPAGRRQVPPDGAGPASVKPPEPPPPDLKILAGKGKNEAAIDSLEDEMARMLGRPGKS